MTTTALPPKKAPVKKRLRALRKQYEQIAYDKKFGAARGGTRAGKSFGFALWFFFKRVQPYPLANHVVVGADYEQLRRGFFDLLIGLFESFGWEEGVDYRYRESPSPMIFIPRLGKRCRIRSLSTKLVERIRGMSIQTLLLEEPQTWGTKAMSGRRVYEILVGRLSHSQTTAILYPDMQPQLRMSFNPPSEGSWLYELIEEQWPAHGYQCWRFSVRDNYLLHDREAYVEALESNLDPRRQPAEIDGHWMRGGGGVYYAYDPEIHGKPPEGIPAVDAVDMSQPLAWSHDFNVHLMCSVIAQVYEQPKALIPPENPEEKPTYAIPVAGWQEKVLRALDEFALEDSSSPQVLEAFLNSRWFEIAMQIQERSQDGFGLYLYGDPAGNSRSQTADARGASRTNWDILKNGLRAAGLRVKMRVRRAQPTIVNRVNRANEQFIAGHRPGMSVDARKCKVLVRDWREVQWAKNGLDIIKTQELSHASDAWAYFCDFERTIEQSNWSYAIAKNR